MIPNRLGRSAKIGLAALCFNLAIAGGAQEPRATNSKGDELARAQVLIDGGKLDQAIALLNSLAEKDPRLIGVEAKLGKAYYEKRNYPQAITHLESALKEMPWDGETTQLLGLAYYLSGHVQQAIPQLEKVQSVLPRPDVTGSYILGISYMQLYQFDKSRAAFAKMFSLPADSAGAHLALAQMMMHYDFEEKALPELEQALALDPRLPMAHFLLGEIYLYKADVPASLEHFQKEIEINPILWIAYWRMGDAYSRIEKWDEAERVLKQSIWLNETFSGPYILLGKVELKKGDAQLAAGFLERGLKVDPNNVSAHYLLGQAYRQLGRGEEADRQFELSRTLRGSSKPQPE
jgi:tetratricopeptide (TPR) repeat protein